MMRRVSIIQREIPHYRIRFFEELYAQGRLQGLDVRLYAGVAPPQPASQLGFPYAVLPVRALNKKRLSPYWMPGLESAIAGSEIIVAPQELQCLTVPYLWAKRKQICNSWIWWGHGYNAQASLHPSAVTTFKEAMKYFMTSRADGLLTYTARGAEYWRRQGLPGNRVSPYNNTIDVEELRGAKAKIGEQQIAQLRQYLKIEGKRVLLFSGRLYAEKKVDFLLSAYALLKKSYPDVALLIIGDGEERNTLEQSAQQLELQDVHFLGSVVDPQSTAAYFSLADLLVIPGVVGLAIVHGFAFGLPLVTTDTPGHGPELDYLSETNGVMTEPDILQYAESIKALLTAPMKLESMKQSARAQGDALYLPLSVKRFVAGIQSFSSTCA